ncbi:hypothetical protein [Streptomyces shenzhenensis]|uniref:hypothetical protein n=1 Tax=Streptomyces shenzhenensis TaxID=943815 RepID=UPI001604FE52
MITIRQSALALGGVASLAAQGILSLITDMGMRDALVWALLAQLAGLALTIALSLRLPRRFG